MRAVAADAEIAGGAEHLAPDALRWTVDDHAGIVAARRARKHRIGHQPGRGLHVGRIDCGGLDLDQHFVCRACEPPSLDRGRERIDAFRFGVQPHAARIDGESFRILSRLHENSSRRCGNLRAARARSATKSPLMKASFFARLHFSNLRSFSIASVIRSEPLREDECHRTARRGVTAKRSVIMLGNPYFQCCTRGADVITSVGTSKNVKKGALAILHARDLPIPHPEESALARASKDEAKVQASWFETRFALLTMRVWRQSYPFGRLS